MSSLRNAIPRKAHRERSQPHSRRKFGLLEKHKDYVLRAKAYNKKQETLQRLKEKAAFKNPDEFNFGMIKSKTVDGVHRSFGESSNYTHEELMLMKTQDIAYLQLKLQAEKKQVEKLSSSLHGIANPPSNNHKYFAEDREEAREIKKRISEVANESVVDLPDYYKRKVERSYRELEARKNRASQLETLCSEMELQRNLQKKGNRRKLKEEELVCPTSRPVYKWRSERKR